MSFAVQRRWMYGLIPQATANGLANVLLLLFLVVELRGSLLDLGLVATVSALSIIPSLIFWGWLVDRTGRCKPFLLISFVGVGLVFLLIPFVRDVPQLLVLSAIRSVAYSASLPARQILTVESESREGWQGGMARMQFLTGLGETLGMGMGAATFGSLGFGTLFVLCGFFCIISALASALMVQDPWLMIERRLVVLERFTNTLVSASTLIGNADTFGQTMTPHKVSRMFHHSARFFFFGVFSFSLGGVALYSPLPAYFLSFFSTSTVFIVFLAGSMANALCYLLVNRMGGNVQRNLILTAVSRMLLIPLLIIPVMGLNSGLFLAVGVLASLGAAWALFDVASTCMFLEISQRGRAGFYGASIGLGSAVGGILGGYISMEYGFGLLFTFCSLIYAGSLIAFVLQFKR
ncbi:MAG: MFS transporter [Thaumarchaeota archaeon]|nr:MFS transporter [Nitrososphaerota archaeon]